MAADSIYLDHNSTTPIDPRVLEAMTRAWRECGANPASQHAPGRRARRMLEEAREGILELLGAKTGGMDADQLIFTSGGTEANNLAILGIERPAASAVCISPYEHPSVVECVKELARRGERTSTNFDTTGEKLVWEFWVFTEEPIEHGLFSMMLANNETGIIYPIKELATKSHMLGVPLHTDAVQAIGKIPVHFGDLGVAAMTVAPHKFHGPLGIGALIVRHDNDVQTDRRIELPIKLRLQLLGGFQQGGARPGTENVALAVGFREALRLAVTELPKRRDWMTWVRDDLEQRLKNELTEMIIIGEDLPRLPNTSCVSFPGVNRQALVMALDMAGVACSTGSACASGSSEPSPTLVAMGLPKDVIEGAIRLSLGAFTTAEEVAEAARRIIKAVKHLRSTK